ncbi:response regulator [Celeribacter sp. SCSIO 80788]|uniref:response regulator n=1 Tax=Celeribacter sp. SCSIO 80788 TaxID=3117013 RepID=UPI003DA2ED80
MTPDRKPRNSDVPYILLVEDDDGDAKAITRAFAKAESVPQIVRVTDGVEALALLRSQSDLPSRRCIMLVDINMPRMNGLECIRELRRDGLLDSAIVFVMSTSDDARDKIAAYKENIAGYILKDRAGDNLRRVADLLVQYLCVVELPEFPALE